MGMIDIMSERKGGIHKAVENFKESLYNLKEDFEELLDAFDEMGERGGSSGGSSGGGSYGGRGGSYGGREEEDRYWRDEEMGERRGRRRRR
jgi:hypothetical protein